MFQDESVKAIIAAIGGNHSNHLLRFLDYGIIAKNPKIFIGYSDITVLHYALQKKAKLATYYGPCLATQFAEFPEILPYTKQSFLDAVVRLPEKRGVLPSESWTDEFLDWFKQYDLKRARKQKDNSGYRWLRPGLAKGEALPVCNFSVNRLLGTEFWINPSSKIVFLDLVLESLGYGLLDASLTDLANAGFFDNLNGLVISRPAGFSEKEIELVYSRILELTTASDYPILVGFDIGHTDPINTIRYGQLVSIDSEQGEITFLD